MLCGLLPTGGLVPWAHCTPRCPGAFSWVPLRAWCAAPHAVPSDLRCPLTCHLSPGAAAVPAEPAHGPLGRRGGQPAAGRGLPPEVRLRRRPQSLQEVSGPAQAHAGESTARRCRPWPRSGGWTARPRAPAGRRRHGPGLGGRRPVAEIPKRAGEGPGRVGHWWSGPPRPGATLPNDPSWGPQRRPSESLRRAQGQRDRSRHALTTLKRKHSILLSERIKYRHTVRRACVSGWARPSAGAQLESAEMGRGRGAGASKLPRLLPPLGEPRPRPQSVARGRAPPAAAPSSLSVQLDGVGSPRAGILSSLSPS